MSQGTEAQSLVRSTTLPDVLLVCPRRFGDERGWFAEFFNATRFAEAGLPTRFVQDNQSLSRRGVLRGLHYQLEQPQGKLVRVLQGHIWDVAVDLRRGSPTFGQWAGFHLRPVNANGEPEMLWVPEGFGHGFLVLSETAEVLYKTTDFYHPASERTVLWNDSALRIEWPIAELGGVQPVLSDKDAKGKGLHEADLPTFTNG